MRYTTRFTVLFSILVFVFFTLSFALPGLSSAGEKEVKEIVEKVSPSVVKVEVQNGTKRVATGVVLDRKGHIVTTALVSPRDEKIVITTHDGKKSEAEFLGLDSETHIAVLRVKERNLVPIERGKIKRLSPGSWIGVVSVSPENEPATSQGIVSSISQDELRLNVWVFPGWSGSPVVDRNGYMVGLLRGIYTDEKPVVFRFKEKEIVGSGFVYSRAEAPSSGIALAVPVDVVNSIAAEIEEKGKVQRGWLGVRIMENEEGKVEITEVEDESPAEMARLEKGDVILMIDGKEIKGSEMFAHEIRSRKPGKDVVLEVERDGKMKKIRVKLGEYPEKEVMREFEIKFPRLFPSQPPKSGEFSFEIPVPEWRFNWGRRKYIGVYLDELTEELSAHFGVDEGKGLIISKFSDDSPARKAGLKVGDVIIKADGVRVESINKLNRIIQKKEEGEKIRIEFLRNKKKMSVEVEVKGERIGKYFENLVFSKPLFVQPSCKKLFKLFV